jgi:hypothetical protein
LVRLGVVEGGEGRKRAKGVEMEEVGMASTIIELACLCEVCYTEAAVRKPRAC